MPAKVLYILSCENSFENWNQHRNIMQHDATDSPNALNDSANWPQKTPERQPKLNMRGRSMGNKYRFS